MSKKNKNRNNKNKSAQLLPLDYNKAVNEAKALISSVDKKLIKSVPKGVQYDWLNNASFNNVVYPKDKIPDRMLRLVERRNGVVGSGITLRIQQAMEFSNISHDKDIPGWELILIDEDETLTDERKKQKRFMEDFFMNMKRSDYNGLEHHSFDFKNYMTKYVRDRITIDKITWEVERDRKGQALAIWCLDGATILPILPGGFYGSTSQIGVSGAYAGYNRLTEEIRKAKLEDVPPIEEISYIQELLYGSSGGGIVAAFRDTDVIYDISNELNDIRYYKQGFSVVEKANLAIVAFINSLTYNSNGLSRSAIPKIAIAMGADSNYTQEQLEDAQDEWMANYMGVDGQWNIPLLNSDAKVLQLMPNNRDMEYQKFMEFVAALTLTTMGIDPAECGLRLNQAQNVLNENQDAKQVFSKNRGLKDLLGGFAVIANKVLKISGFPFAADWKFKFNGLEVSDKGFESDLAKKAIETDMTINESRKKKDLPPDPYGDIICNPQYIQYRIQKEQMEQQQQMGGGMDEGMDDGQDMSDGNEENQDNQNNDYNFDDEEIGGMVDDAMNNMQKAVRLI